MLLRKMGYRCSSKVRIVIGQFALIAGITGIMLNRYALMDTSDFMDGFMMGISGAFIGISVVFNLSMLPKVKERFNLN